MLFGVYLGILLLTFDISTDLCSKNLYNEERYKTKTGWVVIVKFTYKKIVINDLNFVWCCYIFCLNAIILHIFVNLVHENMIVNGFY